MDDVSIKVSSPPKHLPAYFMNAEDALRQPLPRLFTGKPIAETVGRAPPIKRRFHGNLGHWDHFEKLASEFFVKAETTSALKRCNRVPISVAPNIKELNSNTHMVREKVQVGAEITLSGRFFANALATVIDIVETLASDDHGDGCADPEFLPRRFSFGDSWIIDQKHRVQGHEPDVILKLPSASGHRVRLVGELKFCVTVNLSDMVNEVKGPEEQTSTFRDILGQIVDYMCARRLKYGFLSNYEQTVFLKVDQGSDDNPCLYFSDVISSEARIEEKLHKVSLRLALFYMVFLTCSHSRRNDWEASNDIQALRSAWVKTSPKSFEGLVSPDGDRNRQDLGDMPPMPAPGFMPPSLRGPRRRSNSVPLNPLALLSERNIEVKRGASSMPAPQQGTGGTSTSRRQTRSQTKLGKADAAGS